MSNIPAASSGNSQHLTLQQQLVPTTSAAMQQQQQQQQHNNGLLSPNSVTAATMTALDHYRLSQLYQYALAAERLRCAPPQTPNSSSNVPFQQTTTAMNVFRPEMAVAAASAMPLLYNNPYYRLDPRLALYRPPEEPKPQHSYIGLIAMAILGSPEVKLVLSDIYQYILDNYAYFRSRGPGWRNSIRHNLSLNDCFVKAGRSANGKGHYWAIHPANMEDFQKGDFRRRKAQRKVRRHMGLAVDDEDSPSPPPNSPPLSVFGPSPGSLGWPIHHPHPQLFPQHPTNQGLPGIGFGPIVSPNSIDFSMYNNARVGRFLGSENIVSTEGINREKHTRNVNSTSSLHKFERNRKRQFDVASLLAPEMKETLQQVSPTSSQNSDQLDNDDNDQCSSSPVEKSSKKSCSSVSSTLHNQSDVDDDEEEREKDESIVYNSGTNIKTDRYDETHSNSNSSPTTEQETKNRNNFIPAMSTSSLIRRPRHHRRRHHSRSRSSSSVKNTNCSTRTYDPSANNNKGQSNSNIINIHTNAIPGSNNGIPSSADHLRDFPFGFPPNEQQQLFFSQGEQQGSGINNNSQLISHTNHMFFQQNPSLASLMILSSRYRELKSSLQQQNSTKRSS